MNLENILGTVSTGGLNKLMGGGGGQIDMGQNDTRLGKMRDMQQKAAADFEKNQQGYVGKQTDLAADSTRQALANRMAGIKAAASGRGLLYSGLRAGEESNARAQASSGMSQQRANINQGAEEMKQNLQNQAVDTGTAINQMQQQREMQKYNLAQQQAGQRGGLLKGLLGGAGSIAGAMSGGKNASESK